MKINQLKFICNALAVCFGVFFVGANAQQQSQVYRCQQGDVVVYSQVPCDSEQTVVTVKSSQGKGLTAKEAEAKLKSDQDSITGYVRTQDIEAQIAEHYRQIAKLERELTAQLTQLKQRRFRTEQQSEQAYKAIEQRFVQNIEAHHKAIKELNKQLKAP